MKIHEEILTTARRLCIAREAWTFTPAEIVHALPHLNERSVRTHVVSRCCTNAPSHHAHRWPYFKRVDRGVYEIQEKYREPGTTGPDTGASTSQVAKTRRLTHRVPSRRVRRFTPSLSKARDSTSPSVSKLQS